jgi:flagellar biogenesis protein FliO
MSKQSAAMRWGLQPGGTSHLAAWLAGLFDRWRSRSPRTLRLCESLNLGERRFVAVVQFEQQRFLIGGTGNSVVLLSSLPSPSPVVNCLAAGERRA